MLQLLLRWACSARWDIALALAIGAFELIALHVMAPGQPERRTLDGVGLGLLASGVAAVMVRRRYPVAVLGVTFAATLLYWLLDYPRGPIFLPVIVAVFTVATGGRRAAAWAALLAGFVAFSWLPYLLGNDPAPSLPAIFGLAGWIIVLAVAAEAVRIRREREIAAVKAREEETRRRITDERVRFARELHDVLAHSISVINVQAGVGLHLIDERPEQARTALAAIKDVSKDALHELRSVLSTLRQDGEPPLRTPTMGLASLDDLVARAEAGGLTIHTETAGSFDRLPSSVDLAAFRILQEALTNVIRHAGPVSATVRVTRHERDLILEVDDDGGRAAPSKTSDGVGSGIVGMRERASALGGIVEAGPRAEGGFRVTARLPLDGET